MLRALLCASLVALLVACADPAERRDAAMRRGLEYLAADNLEKARVEFQNALQVAPQDAEVRFRNGLVLDRLGKPREAAQFYEGVLDLQPAHHGAGAGLARLYVFAGQPAQALEVLGPPLATPPRSAELLALRATALAAGGDRAAARIDAEQAYALEPTREDVVAVLAGLHAAEGRDADARQLLERAIAARPEGTELRLALSQLIAAEDPAGAEAQLRELVRLQPADRNHRLRLAQHLARSGRPDDAETVLREALAAQPADRQLGSALVALVGSARGPAAARAELERQLAERPGDAATRFALAQLLGEQGDGAAAERLLREVIERDGIGPDGLAARTRLAALRLAADDRPGAEQLVAAVLSTNPRDTDALILRGTLRLAAGDATAAIADLRAVLREQPGAPGVLRALAQAHLVNREPALAEEALRQALEAVPGDAAVALELGQLLARLGRAAEAQPLLARAAKDRQDVASLAALARAAVATRDFATAREAAERARRVDPGSHVGPLLAGMVAEAEGRNAAALAAYEQALALAPRAAEPLQGVVRTLVRDGRRRDAYRRLESLARAEPGYALPPLLQGELALAEGRNADAARAFDEAARRAPRWWLPARGAAQVELARGDAAAAVRLLEAARPRVDEPLAVRLELASLYASSGRVEQAIREYEEVIRAAPDTALAANNLAMLLVTHRRDAASLERANQLAAPLADSPVPQFVDTYGWVRLRSGDVPAAVAALERAAAAAPGDPVILFHLAMAQLESGRPERARAHLGAALASGREFPEAVEARAALARLDPP
jgi:tetratricopeptide (TPR) repeat protein